MLMIKEDKKRRIIKTAIISYVPTEAATPLK
jgi:hypothetical protein